MKQQPTLYIGMDKVAIYDLQGKPNIDIPPGWPEQDTFTNDSPLLRFTPEEIKNQYNIEFPIQWKDISGVRSKEEENEIYLKLNYHNYQHAFPSGNVSVEFDTVENLVAKKQPFYYVVYSMTKCWYKKPTFGFSAEITDAIQKGLCKVLFTFLHEGYLNTVKEVEWISQLGAANNLNPSNFTFVHSNLKFNETINKAQSENIKVTFSYLPINYFEYIPAFVYPPYVHKKIVKSNFKTFLNDNKNKVINKHFNILNRRPRHHRIILFTEIMTNAILKENCEISLGTDGLIPNNEHVIQQLEYIFYNYPEYKKNYEFAKTHDFLKSVELDVTLEENRATEYTRGFYKNTFCSLTSETLVSSDTLFFSEKTFKPIYNLQPFLFLGNPFSLKKLKEMGYRTFDKWWDESYDEETDYLKRIKKISAIMEEICTWSHEKCIKVTQEMEETLIHNFNNFLNNTRYEDFILKLHNKHKREIKQTLI